jgi:hypothetical protein
LRAFFNAMQSLHAVTCAAGGISIAAKLVFPRFNA